jgi:hypothetical protein
MLSANKGGVWGIGGGPCPDWEHSRAAAVVNIEHPTLEGLGFVLLLAGFLIQLLAIPSPRTIVQLREDMRMIKKEEKLLTRKRPVDSN